MVLPPGSVKNLAGGGGEGRQAQELLLAVDGGECLECGRVYIYQLCGNLGGKLDLVVVSQ